MLIDTRSVIRGRTWSEFDDMSSKKVQIYEYLNSEKIKHSNRAFIYLFTAICLLINHGEAENVKLTDIYKEIAEDYGTSCYCVERAIRHEIQKKNLTNKEFITKAIHDINYGRLSR